MALNKNALIRYKTIDKCLQNRQRRWTLNDLIEACSDALYEYEGKEHPVSKRTVQLDIQMMRSDKLGYNAPIITYDKKYYTYEDEHFSITDIPLTDVDMSVLSESMEMLKQFKDFSLFTELNGIIQKLEDKIYTEQTDNPSIIHIDKNEQLKGLKYLDTLYQAILKKIVIDITYQSFKARQPSTFAYHPYILKEFNNRWFIVGRVHKQDAILTLALDRLLDVKMNLTLDYVRKDFNADTYYEHTYGVTVFEKQPPIHIILKIDGKDAPYVLTKPFHHSQKVVEEFRDRSVIISLDVHHNYELERLILGFANSIEVLEPVKLRRRIRKKHKDAYENYAPK